MMKAGNYYIGDLCYVMHDKWDEFCEVTIKDNQCKEGEFHLENGVEFATYGTQYGDGVYYDQSGNEYGVDAGLIGCILIKDINEEAGSTNDIGLGHIYNFDKPFKTGRTPTGTIYFGQVYIKTGDDSRSEDWN